MSSLNYFYPEVKFGGFTDVDGTIAFFNRVNALLEPSFVVLDVGCGRGSHKEDPVEIRKNLRILKDKVSKVIGIDVDENAMDNPYINEFHLIHGDAWPVADSSVDLIICDYVVEHIEKPDDLFREFRRVLKHEGYLCIRTTNRWGYVGIIAALIPNKYHRKILSVAQKDRREMDVFPTRYRCNSVGEIGKMMKAYGLESVVYAYEAEPSYLSFSRIAYWFGVMHQKFAPSWAKPAIFAFGRINKK